MSTTEDSILHTRFRSERLRLGLSHQRAADLAGYSRGSVISWEKGTALPADALERLAAYGMDVQYVVSGIRSANLQAVTHFITAEPPEPLSAREQVLLENYRSCSEEARAALEKTSAALAGGKAAPSSTVRVRASGGSLASAGDINIGSPPKRRR